MVDSVNYSICLESLRAQTLGKWAKGLAGLAAIGVTLNSLAAAAQQAPAESPQWAKLPRMQLQRQFAGPLQDTIVQRWRDPVDGTVCYIYLPITAAHSAPVASGFVQYGANTIGSISCIAETGAVPAKPDPRRR